MFHQVAVGGLICLLGAFHWLWPWPFLIGSLIDTLIGSHFLLEFDWPITFYADSDPFVPSPLAVLALSVKILEGLLQGFCQD